MAWDPGFEVAFNPRSVAVLGASTKERGGGNGFIRGMQEMEYEGKVYPINPNADEIMGYKCYPSLAAVPEVPDLVIVAVGAASCRAGARRVHRQGRSEHPHVYGRLRGDRRGGRSQPGRAAAGGGAPRQAQHRRAELHGHLLAAGAHIALGQAAHRGRARRHDHAERRARQRVRAPRP